MEEALFAAINGLVGHNDTIDSFFVMISSYGPYLLISILALLWFWPSDRSLRDRWQWGVVIALLSTAVALFVNQIIIQFWTRPRPFTVYAATLLLPPSQEPSFPSDHATFGFAIAIALFLVSRRIGILTLLFAALIAFSRVYTGEHYVSDVIAGALIGGVIALLFTWATPYLEPVIAPVLRLARRLHLA